MLGAMKSSAILVMLALVPGCWAAAMRPNRARAFHAALVGCPEDRVVVREIGRDVFVANGCGHAAAYHCGDHDCVQTSTAYQR